MLNPNNLPFHWLGLELEELGSRERRGVRGETLWKKEKDAFLSRVYSFKWKPILDIAKGNGCGLLSETTQNILFKLSHKQLEESVWKDTESDSKPPNVKFFVQKSHPHICRGRCECWNQPDNQVCLRHRGSRENTVALHNSIEADLRLTKAKKPWCPVSPESRQSSLTHSRAAVLNLGVVTPLGAKGTVVA